MPNAGVDTLVEQPDEEHSFGLVAPLVAEWRQLLAGDEWAVSRVDRARVSVRRWELETEMLSEYHLPLPPETSPLAESRRQDHLRRKKEALAEALWKLSKVNRVRLLQRVVVPWGVWWK